MAALRSGMDIALNVCHTPTDTVRDAILAPLADYNAENGYPADRGPIAIAVKNDDGEIIGGLWGRTVYDWLFVEYLVVPPAMRGRDLGAKLMSDAEEIARDRGCVGSWLTTFSFKRGASMRSSDTRYLDCLKTRRGTTSVFSCGSAYGAKGRFSSDLPTS